MSGINAETTFERNRTRLARGRAFAGGVGLLKLLLLLAPFALFGGCSSQPEVYTGLNLLTISAAASRGASTRRR